MASIPQPLRDQLFCTVCSIPLDSNAPAGPSLKDENQRGQNKNVWCTECWLRSLRSQTVDCEQARGLDQVFEPIALTQPL
jgi:hypothetical protein